LEKVNFKNENILLSKIEKMGIIDEKLPFKYEKY